MNLKLVGSFEGLREVLFPSLSEVVTASIQVVLEISRKPCFGLEASTSTSRKISISFF